MFQPGITLVKAGADDIPALLDIEKSVAGSQLYSAMISAEEWYGELARNFVFLIKKDGATVGSIMYEIMSP